MLPKMIDLSFYIEVMAGFRWMTPEDAVLTWNGSANKRAAQNLILVKIITSYMSFQ